MAIYLFKADLTDKKPSHHGDRTVLCRSAWSTSAYPVSIASKLKDITLKSRTTHSQQLSLLCVSSFVKQKLARPDYEVQRSPGSEPFNPITHNLNFRRPTSFSLRPHNIFRWFIKGCDTHLHDQKLNGFKKVTMCTAEITWLLDNLRSLSRVSKNPRFRIDGANEQEQQNYSEKITICQYELVWSSTKHNTDF
ncbi:uncharacterized protein BDR25DRAFT_358487 [Lindgomyces ingoldianus]|uniref:Uncharacterized protein n=1 Tax=Lindgomyces ingoldianus TaxID=673940 RepID=A0ACB6QKG5_9PLEO|nr:uncharacterized protein BDR25DRAFT_358487 [Lindgomyces ingoldianus]KAF2467381.1 hypothetical protein BDR25DRAFT_358487 [Lindgomyces ingoldianus]